MSLKSSFARSSTIPFNTNNHRTKTLDHNYQNTSYTYEPHIRDNKAAAPGTEEMIPPENKVKSRKR